MNSEWFEKVIKEQIKICEDVLIGKAKEYATDDDRLHNFKNAAGMMSCDTKNALAGMMAKHTISVYDMCRSGKDYPIELWNEKITDHINYLLLLKAIVEEDYWHETLGNEGEKYANKMIVEPQNELDVAIGFINKYYSGEFDYKEPLTKDKCNLKNIGLAYTEYNEHTIQVDVNLVDFVLTTRVDDKVYEELKYPSLRRLIDDQLKFLDFGSLVAPIYDLDVGEPIEIEKQEIDIDELIKGLIVCADDNCDCKNCPYYDGNYISCNDRLENDAAKLLEEYKEILNKEAPNDNP